MHSDFDLHLLTPVFNDWESLQILISEIEKQDNLQPFTIKMVIVNDGSTDEIGPYPKSNKIALDILHLKSNVGHQRSIAIGLQYIVDTQKEIGRVIVLDSDGEDKPEDIYHLIQACNEANNSEIIFAKRDKRNESTIFKLSYFTYKLIFRALTGFSMNYGNFSCIPEKLVKPLIFQADIWNHFAGSVFQSKIPYKSILLNRGKRYRGVSKMNLNGLILHGLSAISIYFDAFTIRILKGSFLGILIGLIFILSVLYQKLVAGTAIPGWASSLILIVSGIILQLFSVTLIVLLLQLSKRKTLSPPDNHLYKAFIESIDSSN
ncbi:MAG: glycosyltransferase [Bacteroidales bacterium]|nr:glycosyltransferase [Bacteroidales bacterium]